MSDFQADYVEHAGYGRDDPPSEGTQQDLPQTRMRAVKRGTMSEDTLERLAEAISARVLSEIRVDIKAHEARVSASIAAVQKELGELSQDGRGGTGLVGQLARTNDRVDQLFKLRYIGGGAFLALSLSGAVLYLGVKAWVVEQAQAAAQLLSR